MADPSEAMDRFMDKVQKWADHWIWTGAVSMTGYPNFRTETGQTKTAARWLKETTVPAPYEGAYLRNRCGERLCVRPSHWEWE